MQKTIMAVVALATGVAVAGTTTVSSVEDMPASGGEGTIRYTGATGTVTKDVTLTPDKNKAATLEVPADTTLTFSGKFDVSTGAFIKSGAGTVKLPYVGSYYLGVTGATTANAPLTWNDGNAVNGYTALTVADGTLEVGAQGATVNKVGMLSVGVRYDSATDPTFKLVGGSMTVGDLQIDRGTSENGKQVQPTLLVTGSASLTADNWNTGSGGATGYTNNTQITVSGAGSVFTVSGFHTASSLLGTQTLNVTDGGTFAHTRGNMDYNTSIGFLLGGWEAGTYSGSEWKRLIVNVDGGTLKAATAYLYRYSEINVTNGGKLLVGRPVMNFNHLGVDAQRGALHFDNGTMGNYANGVCNWFCGITNYTVGAGGMTVESSSATLVALSGHASYANAAAKAAGAEIGVSNHGGYVALGAGEVPIRADDLNAIHMTVNGRHLGSRSTGRIRPADGKNLVITVAGDNALQEMVFQPSGRTRFRHQGIEADIKRWATVGAAMPMANGTLALGHRSDPDRRGAVWLRDKLSLAQSFKVSWTYHCVSTGNFPYGLSVVLQNSGLTACGEEGSGNTCCYKGITNSVGMAYDVTAKSLRYGTDGIWQDSTAFDEMSGSWADDPIRLSLSYDAEAKTLTLAALQPTTSKTLTKTVAVDLAETLGAGAYFGFAGGTAASGSCVGYHCVDDVRIDAEAGRGYQKIGGHLELAADQTFAPEILADKKNLGVVLKELTYGANARVNVTPSSAVGLPGEFYKSANLGFDAVHGTGTLVKGGAGALALSAPGAASDASVDVQAGGVVLRHEDLEEPPFSAADGDWCFTGPEIYWRGPRTLQFGPLGNGSRGYSKNVHMMNANTRRRYRVDGDWKATFSAYAEATYGTVPNQGFSFLIHNAAAGSEARATNLCGGWGGSISDKAAAIRFWTSSKFLSYTASSAWNASATAEGSHAFENGVSFQNGSDPIRIEVEHNAAENRLDIKMTQGAKTFTCCWENANLKAKIGNESLAYLSFGAMGQADNPMFFRISDFRFQYLDADPAVEQQPYFGTLSTSVANGLEVTLDAARANLSYRLANALSLGAGSGIKVKAKRAAGTLDLGTVTCAGAASVALADGCTASIAAATGTDDFTVSGDTLTITSPTAFTEETTLRLNDGAKLNLAFAGTLKVRRIYVDGVHQRSGNYTAGDADWIAGGTGHIETGKGFALIVR